MSGSSPPLSPTAPHHNDEEAVISTPVPLRSSTRTVAIIKTHALAHRFDIEHRILEASFEIVKERQLEFDADSDPDFLDELFGEDADSLTQGPVWVYVLERRRAVEVWNTLMGDADPDVARENAPNSLRALYGISLTQNAVMGSADAQTAELQITTLFASSPPFPAAELPESSSHDNYGSTRSISSSVLSALRKRTASDEGYPTSNPSSNGKPKGNGKVLFRARPLPKTHDVPDIQPRTTRAAALRAGIVVQKVPSAPRAPLSKAQLAKTFANVPGHKRAETITVASTAPPVVAPRMTRAASLRLGQPALAPAKRRPSSAIVAPAKPQNPATFEGVPGHKRRDTISVASVKAPIVAPRLNKSAALRAAKDTAPPTSYMFRVASTPKLPGMGRSQSQASFNDHQPPSPPSQSAIQRPRPVSAAALRPTMLERTSQTPTPTNENVPETESPVKPPRPRPASVMAPTIAPRTNRSALLRAAKMESGASPTKSSKPKFATRAMVH